MIRRASIFTPRRRASTPAAHPHRAPETHNAAFLHQTTEGRVERHIRRTNLRTLLHKLEDEKRKASRTAQAQITHLESELKSRDREIYELQNATVVIDTDRIWDLEQQIDDLKDELARRPVTPRKSYDWTMDDPFDDAFMDMGDDFGDTTAAKLVTSTPSRARSSFPTPPATSPCVPATPISAPTSPTSPTSAGVQACLPHPAEEEVASLQREVSKLTATLDSYKLLGERLVEQLSCVDADDVESKVAALVQTTSDRTAALDALSASITDLGFPGADASEMLTTLASGFRSARLELEYLTPGELTLPLTSHGAEVLDLLLTRLRELAKKVKEDEGTIDEYHEIEQSLRKQLDARVSAMDNLRADLSKAERLLNEKNLRVSELQIGNDRLKGAVDGYIRDMRELESLVERMDKDGHDAAGLESKLAEAVAHTEQLQREIDDVQDKSTQHVVQLNRQHGAQLALRDARVLELREEMDRVNASLRDACESVRLLRVQNGGLKTQIVRDRVALDAVRGELGRVMFRLEGLTQKQTKHGDNKKQRRVDSGIGLLTEDEVTI